jgi:hypothetical protein
MSKKDSDKQSKHVMARYRPQMRRYYHDPTK